MIGEGLSVEQKLLEEQYVFAEEIDAARFATVALLRKTPGPWEPGELNEAVVAATKIQDGHVRTAEDELVGRSVIQTVKGQRILNSDIANLHYPLAK